MVRKCKGWNIPGHLKHLGRLGRVQDQIRSVCSAALEAFGTAWTASAPIQLAKSENVGYSDWWCACESARCVGGAEFCVHSFMVCALFFYALRSFISCFPVLHHWHETSATQSRTSTERTRYCVIGSRRGSMFQCNFSAKRVRQEAAGWSD